jgi:hypothetical protein
MAAAAATVPLTYAGPGVVEAATVMLSAASVAAASTEALMSVAGGITVASVYVVYAWLVRDPRRRVNPAGEAPTTIAHCLRSIIVIPIPDAEGTAETVDTAGARSQPGSCWQHTLTKMAFFVEAGCTSAVALLAGIYAESPHSLLCILRPAIGVFLAALFAAYVLLLYPLARHPAADPWEHRFQLFAAMLQALQCAILLILVWQLQRSPSEVDADDAVLLAEYGVLVGMASYMLFAIAAVVLAVRSVLCTSPSSGTPEASGQDGKQAGRPSATSEAPLLVAPLPPPQHGVGATGNGNVVGGQDQQPQRRDSAPHEYKRANPLAKRPATPHQ